MRVLEISAVEEAAAWCGRLFVHAGADVVKAEPRARPLPDVATGTYLNAGKRRVPVDLDGATLRELAGGFDVVVTDACPRDVERHALFDLPARVVVSITPFGLSGPYSDWAATSATLLALGGHTHLMGDQERAPLTMPGRYPWYQAGNFAFVGAACVLLSGAPARIEVSVLECLATLHQFTDTMWTAADRVRRRHGNRWQNLHPVTMLPCADGWFSLNVLDNFWVPFAMMIGRPDLAHDHPWVHNVNRLREHEEVDRVTLEALGTWTKERIFHEGQGTWRVPVGHLQSLGELLGDPHLEARAFWQPIQGVKVPGSPYRIEPTKDGGSPTVNDRTRGSSTRPLEGVRVLELTHFWSGPLCGRLLGDLGADVVLVEAHDARGSFPQWRDEHPDVESVPNGKRPWNNQPLFTKLNRNKRSIAIDLKSARGRDVFLCLVDECDVVIENFSARALPGLGLGHEVLCARNPRLIYVAMPGFGLSGPYRDHVALGPSAEPMTGLTALMGYSSDEPRVTAKAILDPMSGMLSAVSVLDALLLRERTGRGSLVEVSQHECGIAYVGEFLVEAQLGGSEPERLGNAHRSIAPHGVYRCTGADEWIALCARDELEWTALCRVAGRGWQHDPRFADGASRLLHRRVLDESVEAFTRTREKYALACELQSGGVPAGPVLSAPEWLSDPHLDARGYFTELADADCEPRRGDGLPILIDGRRNYEGWRRGPTLGEHNAEVLRERVGLSDGELAALVAGGVLADRPT